MSWHCLPELVAEYSGVCSSAGAPSQPSRSTLTAGKSCSGGSETACSTCSPSGTTSEPSTARFSVERWTSSLRASRANRSRSQERGAEPTTSATCGPTPSVSFARWSPDSRCWKTSQGLFELTISAKSSETWQTRGSMRSGKLYPRPRSERRTFASDSGSPHVCEFPTPTAGDSKASGSAAYSTASGRHSGTTLTDAVVRLPTPQARDWKGPSGRSQKGTERDLPSVVAGGGKLNPRWVEWLMGWPIGWVSFERLETDRFHEWLRKHGVDCEAGSSLRN